ncbi:MAG TPA: hypothetical protein VFT22_12820, partial [Kofleriaceae bacterium]|nr:hypothetical protein [Kofleriaceae bacterium]
LFSLVLVSALPLGVLAPGCSSTNTSSVGQRISCTDTGAGVTNCHPVDSTTTGSGSDTCEDIDDDGDGMPHDEGEDSHALTSTGTVSDRDQDGVPDSADDDMDGDGIPNARDCDSRHGGDDDDGADDTGSGSGSGSGG